MLEGFDDVKREIDASGTMKGIDAFTARAFDMVASGTVRKALDFLASAGQELPVANGEGVGAEGVGETLMRLRRAR